MNWRRRFNPFITFWGYVLSTAALGLGLAMGWFFHSQGDHALENPRVDVQPVIHLPREAGAYRVSATSIAPAHAIAENRIPGAKIRDAKVYEGRRAYPGAPPRIPHEIPENLPGFNCLACHEQGGYAARFHAYAPKTPHPEWTQCRQCHVTSLTPSLFTGSHFMPVTRPETKRAYEGAPPPIPHDLQYRENCSACHTGPGAMAEIRTSHPERIGCNQCHVPSLSTSTFIRALAGVQP